jgi:serine/threonine protein kinase
MLHFTSCDIMNWHYIDSYFCCGSESEQGIFEQVLKGDLDFSSEPWPSISESAKDLVRKMLIRDPKKRLTAHEALCK